MSDDTSQPEVSLEPGDLSAQDLVALHHDLEGDPASGAYRKAWDVWHTRASKLAPPVSARVTEYIDATFPAPGDRSRRAATAAGIAAAGLGAAEIAGGGGGAATAAGGVGAAAVAPDAAARAAAGQVAAAGGPTPVAAAPDAGARQAAGVVDETRWDGTPARPKRRGRWLVVGAAVLVIAAGAIGAAIVVNNNSSGSSKPTASTSSAVPVVKSLHAISTPITTCLERVRQPYQIVKNAKSYVGKTAVVAAEGSREGSAQAVVQANGTFTVVFTQPLQRVSATKCSGKLTLTVESIGGVTPTVIS